MKTGYARSMKRSTAYFEDGDEWWRCRAVTKKSKRENPDDESKWTRCQGTKVPGRNVCRVHGGCGGRPPGDRDNFTAAFGRCGMEYWKAKNDPELWNPDRNMAVFQMAVTRAAERMQELDTPDFRRELRALWQLFLDSEDPEQAEAHCEAITRKMDSGIEEDRAFEQLIKRSEQAQRHIERQAEILLRAQNVMPIQDVVTVLVRVLSTVQEVAGDDPLGAAIVEKLDSQLMGAGQSFAASRGLPDPSALS